jgi:hypothetical protein
MFLGGTSMSAFGRCWFGRGLLVACLASGLSADAAARQFRGTALTVAAFGKLTNEVKVDFLLDVPAGAEKDFAEYAEALSPIDLDAVARLALERSRMGEANARDQIARLRERIRRLQLRETNGIEVSQNGRIITPSILHLMSSAEQVSLLSSLPDSAEPFGAFARALKPEEVVQLRDLALARKQKAAEIGHGLGLSRDAVDRIQEQHQHLVDRLSERRANDMLAAAPARVPPARSVRPRTNTM